MKTLISSIAALFFSAISVSYAQLNIPQPSPASSVMQKVGLAEVTVYYSRPSAKGRKIYGELVPFNKIWRTGANAPTKVSFSDTVTVEGKKLAPGDYALYTIPGESEWTIIFGKDPKVSAGDYKEGEEAARFKVKSQKSPVFLETFTIGFNDLKQGSATMALVWANTVVPMKVENDFDAKVMAQIKDADSDMEYYQAAAYYLETNRDLNQALEWVNKATANDPKFWQLHTKAKIQAKLNDKKGAIETAKKSIELAKQAKNEEYVKMNEKLIADLNKKKK